jgi:hypothetical protein
MGERYDGWGLEVIDLIEEYNIFLSHFFIIELIVTEGNGFRWEIKYTSVVVFGSRVAFL